MEGDKSSQPVEYPSHSEKYVTSVRQLATQLYNRDNLYPLITYLLGITPPNLRDFDYEQYRIWLVEGIVDADQLPLFKIMLIREYEYYISKLYPY
jgi:hypothetical protein